MKKVLTWTALVVLTVGALAMSGYCESGLCSSGAKKCDCGERKGSAKCATTCQKAAKCACGAVKGSEACAAACKK